MRDTSSLVETSMSTETALQRDIRGYVNSFKSHVNVGFFNGAVLEDPTGLLEGSGKRMRHVKLKPGSEPNAAALRDLIDAAYLDIRARLRGEPSSQ